MRNALTLFLFSATQIIPLIHSPSSIAEAARPAVLDIAAEAICRKALAGTAARGSSERAYSISTFSSWFIMFSKREPWADKKAQAEWDANWFAANKGNASLSEANRLAFRAWKDQSGSDVMAHMAQDDQLKAIAIAKCG